MYRTLFALVAVAAAPSAHAACSYGGALAPYLMCIADQAADNAAAIGDLRLDLAGVEATVDVVQTTLSGVISPAGISSSSLMINPAADSKPTYGISAMYCLWDHVTQTFSYCDADASWAGNANFDVDAAFAAGNLLTIPFQSAYSGRPVCSVEFDPALLWRRVITHPDRVELVVRDTAGDEWDWHGSPWVEMICHGALE